ncbi:hypothetical protein EDB92DRAFT_1484399 [Lactarius akahatsu]|uniref:Uncharacterized protein n=1 Tax=Lactarius akahatsu TaxID=416441 RepID=A0AAD4Q7F3_9AGAM|nr:hypothetical protein EDB92DRAFT_1484399 [Lactarius akahatsu]
MRRSTMSRPHYAPLLTGARICCKAIKSVERGAAISHDFRGGPAKIHGLSESLGCAGCGRRTRSRGRGASPCPDSAVQPKLEPDDYGASASPKECPGPSITSENVDSATHWRRDIRHALGEPGIGLSTMSNCLNRSAWTTNYEARACRTGTGTANFKYII